MASNNEVSPRQVSVILEQNNGEQSGNGKLGRSSAPSTMQEFLTRAEARAATKVKSGLQRGDWWEHLSEEEIYAEWKKRGKPPCPKCDKIHCPPHNEEVFIQREAEIQTEKAKKAQDKAARRAAEVRRRAERERRFPERERRLPDPPRCRICNELHFWACKATRCTDCRRWHIPGPCYNTHVPLAHQKTNPSAYMAVRHTPLPTTPPLAPSAASSPHMAPEDTPEETQGIRSLIHVAAGAGVNDPRMCEELGGAHYQYRLGKQQKGPSQQQQQYSHDRDGYRGHRDYRGCRDYRGRDGFRGGHGQQRERSRSPSNRERTRWRERSPDLFPRRRQNNRDGGNIRGRRSPTRRGARYY